MIARQTSRTFMDFFWSFIRACLDEEMLVCLSTLQSYCLLSVFARGVDNLFGDKTYCTKTIGGWRRKNVTIPENMATEGWMEMAGKCRM